MVISLILAFASGVTIVLSRMITAHLGAYVGTLRSALANYAIGFGGALLLFLLRGAVIRTVQTPASPTRIVDFSGGLLGVMTVLLCIILVPKLPSYVLTLLIFLGQLSSGITLDFLRLGSLPHGKIIGCILITIGLLVSSTRRKDRAEDDLVDGAG